MSNHPDDVLPQIRKLSFVCPICKHELQVKQQQYCCNNCQRFYPVVGGIPDFRVFGDPYLDFAEDAKRTDIVLAALERLNLKDLLEYYWSYSDVTPPLLRARFVQNALRGESRGTRLLEILKKSDAKSESRVLEIGSGTGNFLSVANQYFNQTVGVDIAMRWLHLSRRRFIDQGVSVPALVCCCAEYLPFKSGQFDVQVMVSTLEFLKEPERALVEAARVLGENGQLTINTVNRYSLTTNPYSQLWGVGFLSKKWQVKYVRFRRNASFENIKLFSLEKITELSQRTFVNVEIKPADIDETILITLPFYMKIMIKIYRAGKSMPGINTLLKYVTPEWDIQLKKPRN